VIDPNGKTAYVTSFLPSDTITPVNIATNTPGNPIRLGSLVEGIAITPNGKTAYVASSEGSNRSVTPISTATNRPGTPIPIALGLIIAMTPGGKTLYAVAWDKIVPISTATNTPGTPIPVRYGQPDGIVITP